MLFIHSQRPLASFSCFCPRPTWFIVCRILIMWRCSLLSAPFPSALSLGFCVFGTCFNVSNAKLRRMLSAEHYFSVTTLEMVACRHWKKHALNIFKYRACAINLNFWSLCGVEIRTFCCTTISKAVEILFWQEKTKKQKTERNGNPAFCSPDGQPQEPTCVIHLHIRSLCMWVGGQSYLSLSNNQWSRRGHAVEESRAPPTFRSVLSDKDCWGIRKQRLSLYGWCFKSSGSADEEWRSSNETVSSAEKCLICLRVPVLRQRSAQLIAGTLSQFLINSGTTSTFPAKKEKELSLLLKSEMLFR